MNRFLLDAIMKLFAAISYENGISFQERRVVRNFLTQHLDDRAAQDYLDSFHRMASMAEQPSVTELCSQIARELNNRQKMIVYVRLVETVFADKFITSYEKQALETVALHFKISQEEQNEIQEYHTSQDLLHSSLANLLIITGQEINFRRNIFAEHLLGYIAILRIPSIDLHILRYIGKGDLSLNSYSLHKDETYFMTPGSVIRGLNITPIFQSQIAAKFQSTQQTIGLCFEAKNISYFFPNGKQALHNVNISENSGQLVALMGASGAGKSTLLSVLNGLEKPTQGEVLVNGINIHTQRNLVEGVIGYIAQDDLLIEELTVYENLLFNAKFCFGEKNKIELENLVAKTLKDLGLWEIRHLVVGSPLNKKISGGQRKRLNIALELIREPEVLFVDEPTSGLSSRDSEMVMELLKALALRGKLVFVVIHQPSSDIYKMFDKLFLLDTGGYPVYYGNPVGALSYFKHVVQYIDPDHVECGECGNVNPEMIFNIIEMPIIDENGDVTDQRRCPPEYWNQFYTENYKEPIVQQVITVPEVSLHPPSGFMQFFLYAQRDIQTKSRNIAYLLINFLEAPFLAIILAFLLRYYNIDALTTQGYQFFHNDNIPVYLFVSVLVALFMGLTGSAEEILKDRKVLNREKFLHLSKGAYLSAKMVVLFGISAIQTLTYVIIANQILGIYGMDFSFWVILWSTSCSANLMGLNISSAFDNAVTVYILVPLLLIPQIILSGAVVRFEKLNPHVSSAHKVPLAGELMVSRWAYEALVISQFKHNSYEKDLYPLDKELSISKYKLNDWLPRVRAKFDSVQSNIGNANLNQNYKQNLQILKNELIVELYPYKSQFKNLIDALLVENMEAKTINEIRSVLKALEQKYRKRYDDAAKNRDIFIGTQTKDSTAKAQFLEKEMLYKNDAISNVVQNQLTDVRILETQTALTQRIDPVYNDPQLTSNPFNFRTHFFAPTKMFIGTLYDTRWFNCFVMALITVFSYFLLYFDVFRKLVQLPSRFIK